MHYGMDLDRTRQQEYVGHRSNLLNDLNGDIILSSQLMSRVVRDSNLLIWLNYKIDLVTNMKMSITSM